MVQIPVVAFTALVLAALFGLLYVGGLAFLIGRRVVLDRRAMRSYRPGWRP
jgi:nitrate reductase gamma subunit